MGWQFNLGKLTIHAGQTKLKSYGWAVQKSTSRCIHDKLDTETFTDIKSEYVINTCLIDSFIHVWHAPLGVHSTKRRHQSPEWTILSHINCFIQAEAVGSQIHSCWIVFIHVVQRHHVGRLTSSLRTWWYHLIPNSCDRHQWSRPSILRLHLSWKLPNTQSRSGQ